MDCDRVLMIVVVKLSGSLFKLEYERLKPFFKLFFSLHKEGIKTAVVTGGGEIARKYIKMARKIGCDESTLDEIGIAISRINAKTFSIGLGDLAFPKVPLTLEEAELALSSGKIPVIGGYHPGFSTNAVAALTAERLKADLFVNATDVDGIYDMNPKLHKNARKLDEIRINELIKMLSLEGYKAGEYELMDLVALKVIQRSKIRTKVVLCDPSVIKKAIKNEKVGTEIIP